MSINIKGDKQLLKFLKNLETPIDRKTAKDIGAEVVDQIKDKTARGVNPLTNRPYQKLNSKYANRQKGGNRLPNLRLSGKFMNSLKSKTKKVKGGYTAIVGYSTNLSRKKEQGHAEGANGQAKRPTLSTGGNRQSATFREAINKIALKRIRDLIRRKR